MRRAETCQHQRQTIPWPWAAGVVRQWRAMTLTCLQTAALREGAALCLRRHVAIHARHHVFVCAGMVYVERRPGQGDPREDVPDQATSAVAATGAPACLWGRYDGAAAVDALIDFLNPLGRREVALKRVSRRWETPCLHDARLERRLSGCSTVVFKTRTNC
jgi:hypothetical protein